MERGAVRRHRRSVTRTLPNPTAGIATGRAQNDIAAEVRAGNIPGLGSRTTRGVHYLRPRRVPQNVGFGLVYYPGGGEPYDMGAPPAGTKCFAYDTLAATVAAMFTWTADDVTLSTAARPLIKVEHMRWPFIAYRLGG